MPNREPILYNLDILGVDVDRLSEIPEELAKYIAKLTPEDLQRIRNDVEELERVGLLSHGTRPASE
jgi:hypothetical protein